MVCVNTHLSHDHDENEGLEDQLEAEKQGEEETKIITTVAAATTTNEVVRNEL
jgi:hypothetical protein